MKKIVLTGGGTGGHVTPHLSLFNYLRKDYEIHYIGTNGIEKEIMSNFPFVRFHEIDCVKFQRKLTLKNLLIPFKLIKSKKQAKQLLKKIKPNIIFSKGGYVSIPVVFAGKSLHIPIVSHESDLTMGLANKLIYKKCDCMCTTFEETAKGKKKAMFTGPPIRNAIFQGNKENGYSLTHLNNNRKTILFMGGSTGATAINDLVFSNIKELTKKYNVIHLTGKNKDKIINQPYYFHTEYCSKIEDLLAISDIVISRAGSNVIFELLALKKPMILIPLPKSASRGDQLENAKIFANKKIAKVILQENLNLSLLEKCIEEIIQDKNLIENMNKEVPQNSNKKIFDILKKLSL